MIGCFVVFLFVLGYIINYAENFIPYNIIPRARLNNPNKFNTGYVYDDDDDVNDFSDWCVVLLAIVLRKINRKHRNKEILDTPMKDLVAEHAEDILDKYE